MTRSERIRLEEWDQAVARAGGRQLVVAGPGTGKTEFLVRRAVRLIGSQTAAPEEVLVLTFSRRAAADLRRRIVQGLGRSVTAVNATTFHSFAYRMAEAFAPLHLGWEDMPTLLTGPEHVALVAHLLASEPPAAWPAPLRGLLTSPTLASDVADVQLRLAERMTDRDSLARLASSRPGWRALPAFLDRYREELRRRNRIDYGTLLLTALELLAVPAVARTVADQHRYVLVDEYQDTSPAQAALLEALTFGHGNLTVAGDPYQSIYSFRGAAVDNIARFHEGLGEKGRRVILAESFRVPAEILDAALRVTAGAELPGSAGPVRPAPHSGSVEVYLFDQQSAEAEWIASEAERLHLEHSIPHSRMAVLVRSKRRFVPELSRALERHRIPHDKPDSRLVDHPGVQMVFDVVRAAVCRSSLGSGAAEDLDRAVRRLLLGPLLGLSVGAERALVRERLRTGADWVDILGSPPASAPELAALIADPAWALEPAAVDGFWELWTRLPQIEPLVHHPGRGELRAAWASLAQALERQAERDRSVTLARYLQMSEDDDFEATPLLSHSPDRDRLALTTLHQAKGLEFDVVFIADAVEGVFPDLRRGVSLLQPDLPGMSKTRLQEEVRLAYTAMTRARLRVVWTATTAGLAEADQRPSRFLPRVAGVGSAEELGSPPARPGRPITTREVEALLRQTLVDPEAPAAERLAAVTVLSHPPDSGAWDATRFAGVRPPGPHDGVIEPGLVLSPSQAEMYEQCPRRYVLERRLRVEDSTSAPAQFGSLCHALLETIERRTLDQGRRPSLEEAVEVLDQVWEEAEFGSPVLDAAYRAKAARLLERLWADWPADSAEPVALEHHLELDLGGVRWVGKADRIERTTRGELRIVDYKTRKSLPTIEEAAGSLQLGFYLLAAGEDPDLDPPPSRAELWFPLADARNFRRAFDPDRLPQIEQRLRAVVEGVLDEAWDPRTGPHCRHCAVRSSCPAWPEGREAFSA